MQMNPYTKNSTLIGDITKVAIELNDRQAIAPVKNA
jgi:hypothetical protein